MKKINILDLSPTELYSFIDGLGEKPYRARQLAKWVYKGGARGFGEMTDLSKSFRSRLEECAFISSFKPPRRQESTDGTQKFLFELSDGHRVESVLIPEGKRSTLCVSTQVGCLMGCTFCLTGTLGKMRDLAPAEIISQYLYVNSTSDDGVTNIVFMGMGEPLDNFDNTVASLQQLTDPEFVGMSPRKITVSTSGLIPQIKQLGERAPVNLSVSLNASNDSLREKIMPLNKKYPIKELIQACRSYPLLKRRGVTFEYVLIKGLNDSLEHAFELVGLLKNMNCMVNIIPFNEAPPLPYKSPAWNKVVEFQNVLIANGVRTMVR